MFSRDFIAAYSAVSDSDLIRVIFRRGFQPTSRKEESARKKNKATINLTDADHDHVLTLYLGPH